MTTTSGATTQNLSLSYNANGDRIGSTDSISGTSRTYGYDGENRLTSFSQGSNSATYAYNGDGLRMSKTVNGTAEPFTWDEAEGLPLILQDGTTKYVTGPDGLPLEQVTSSGVLYYYQDQLGSTRGLLDQSGNTVAAYTYDAYGTVTSQTGTVANPFQYAGQYTDAESGLQYLRARYYDPGDAQFLSVDPLVSITKQSYSYANDGPVNWDDLSGLWTIQLCLSGNIGLLLWGETVSGCLATANLHSFGVTASLGVGVHTPALNGQVQLLGSNANCLSELDGTFIYAGASAGDGPSFGLDGFGGRARSGRLIVGGGPGIGLGLRALPLPPPLPPIPLLPLEIHAGPSYTWTKSIWGADCGCNGRSTKP